ncbi:MAG TPA: aromatic-ring-hydroxylating dioxygenase subunit beta [Alphaproteobacteria bacterium]|jgi:3-phenylpropionate/cinnamic acid dioxygenase small subunit|nr:aromatic-ring-hydroxylating dioxygenase subunit beta [Alphaproteobacteria bacterium]
MDAKTANTKTGSSKPSDARALRADIYDFNSAYAACIDDGDIMLWPDFFTEDAVYKVIPRENWDQNLPLATIFAEGRGGLIDRTVAITKTTVARPRYLRHFISNIRVLGTDTGVIRAEANYMVVETMPTEVTRILSAGRYLDKFVYEGKELKLKQRFCIYDSEIVPATIVYPF